MAVLFSGYLYTMYKKRGGDFGGKGGCNQHAGTFLLFTRKCSIKWEVSKGVITELGIKFNHGFLSLEANVKSQVLSILASM